MMRILFAFSLLVILAFPCYAADAPESKAVAEVPLDQPYIEDAALLMWVMATAADTMTFGASDYEKHFEQSKKNFTGAGWDSFDAWIKRQHLVDEITAKQVSLTAAPRTADTLKDHGALNGKYRWIVTMPLIVKYSGKEPRDPSTYELNLVIERVPLSVNASGVQIAQWVVQ